MSIIEFIQGNEKINFEKSECHGTLNNKIYLTVVK